MSRFHLPKPVKLTLNILVITSPKSPSLIALYPLSLPLAPVLFVCCQLSLGPSIPGSSVVQGFIEKLNESNFISASAPCTDIQGLYVFPSTTSKVPNCCFVGTVLPNTVGSCAGVNVVVPPPTVITPVPKSIIAVAFGVSPITGFVLYISQSTSDTGTHHCSKAGDPTCTLLYFAKSPKLVSSKFSVAATGACVQILPVLKSIHDSPTI